MRARKAKVRTVSVTLFATVIAVVGCGSSSGPSSATTATQRSTTTKQKTHKSPGGVSSSTSSAGSKSGASGPASLPNEGTKAVAPGVPTVKGGDNSIQTYGLEAQSAERAKATGSAKAFFDARASGDWAKACSRVSGALRKQLAALAASAKSCEGAMRALTAGVPKSALRSAAQIHVLSFRVKGDLGFLIYRDGKGTPTALPMHRESGAWTVGSLAGSPLGS